MPRAPESMLQQVLVVSILLVVPTTSLAQSPDPPGYLLVTHLVADRSAASTQERVGAEALRIFLGRGTVSASTEGTAVRPTHAARRPSPERVETAVSGTAPDGESFHATRQLLRHDIQVGLRDVLVQLLADEIPVRSPERWTEEDMAARLADVLERLYQAREVTLAQRAARSSSPY